MMFSNRDRRSCDGRCISSIRCGHPRTRAARRGSGGNTYLQLAFARAARRGFVNGCQQHVEHAARHKAGNRIPKHVCERTNARASRAGGEWGRN